MEQKGNLRQEAFLRILERRVGLTSKGCWLWTGAINKNGYGFIEVRFGLAKRIYAVYRLMYEHYNGRLPFGQCVRHTCDVRRCINPEHLIPGSRKENTADMVRAGRAPWQQPKGAVQLADIEDNADPIIDYIELPQPPILSKRRPSSWWKTPKQGGC